MTRTQIRIALGIAAVALAVFVVFLFFGKDDSSITDQEDTAGGNSPTSSSSVSGFTAPMGERFTIQTPRGGVSVRNFYPLAIQTKEDAVLVSREFEFDIVYFRKAASFLLVIVEKPLAQVTQQAEQRLLEVLDISIQDACRLELAVEDATNPGAPTKVMPHALSFCPFER